MELRSPTAALRLPPAAVLVVAGVPGAGKTTLLARVDAAQSQVLDPEAIRARYARRLSRLPYRLWRPLVHAEHYLRVLLALPGRAGLIVHETGTRAWRRRLLAAAARRFGRTAHLLLLDVSAETALRGQRRRRRMVRRQAFRGHWRRWQGLRAALTASAGGRAGLAADGWASVCLLDRAAAGRLRRIDIPRR
jgi:predicted kinase